MDLALWTAQIAVAVGLAVNGYLHAIVHDRATGRLAWMRDVPRPMLRVIGALEVLGAIGLILPWATGILRWLTPVAAIGVVALMVLAGVFHVRRGELGNVVGNVVLGSVAAVIVVGRLSTGLG